MTQSRNIELTPEEQAEIAKNMPQLLEVIEKGSPVAAGWLASWRRQHNIVETAREQTEEIRREVAAAAQQPEQGSLAQWCGFPTDMTRCSPFFPMNVKELGQREFLRDFVIASANWGEIRYTGPKLSTYEEDALMALLAILNDVSQHRQVEEIEGRKTYTYRGPALPLLKILGYSRPNKKDYDRLFSALKLLVYAGLELSLSSGKTKSGKKRSPRLVHISTMLSGVRWDNETKEFIATINPFFYETYMAGRVTLLDVAKRMSLKGTLAKALYRFVQSQRQNPVFVGHYLTLADALNMDREQLSKQLRRQLKTAISELVRQGVLMKKSGFVDIDIIKLERTAEAFPQKEAKLIDK